MSEPLRAVRCMGGAELQQAGRVVARVTVLSGGTWRARVVRCDRADLMTDRGWVVGSAFETKAEAITAARAAFWGL